MSPYSILGISAVLGTIAGCLPILGLTVAKSPHAQTLVFGLAFMLGGAAFGFAALANYEVYVLQIPLGQP